jgi:glycosyltransferase involved in cell wall biosynthesis
MTLSHALVEDGHTVEFCTFKGRGLGEHVRSLGFTTHEVRVRAKLDPVAAWQIRRLLRDGQFDVVHTHLSTSTVNGTVAARLAGIPGVATVHGLSGKLSFLAADHLIAVSSEVRDHMIAQGVAPSKVSIVWNGLRLPDWTPAMRRQARHTLALPLDRPVLGSVARLTPLKGMEHALQAFHRILQDVPEALFLVVGDGEQRAELEARARSLGMGDSVRFLGYRTDVTEILPAFDVFLFPSLKEAMGLAIVEAMAARLPVVASMVGGVPEVVTKGTGLLVPPGDALAMAEAATGLLRDPSRAEEMGQAALERARTEFTAHRMAARTVDVYRAAIARRG